MRMKRYVIAAALAATGFLAMAPGASAQPMGVCGGKLPFPLILPSGCRWVCVREQIGPTRRDRPPQFRMDWRKVCSPALGGGSRGKAEIHRKNVPQVRKNRAPGPND